MHPGERRQAHVAGGLGLLDRELQRGRAGRVVAGLALRPAEAGELVGLRLPEAEPSGRLRGATDVQDGVVEAMLDPGQLAEHRVAADVQPRVVDRAQPVLDLVAGLDGAHAVTGGDRGPGGEEPVRGLIPRPVEPVVERVAAIGQLQRLTELAVMRHDVGQVVTAARLQVDVVDRVRQFGGRGDVLAGELEAVGRRFDPGREQQGAGAVADRGASPAASSARRSRCAPRLSPRTIQAQPNPLTIRSASSGSCVSLQARAASRLARSARAKARWSAWRLLRTPCVEAPAASAYQPA